MTTYNKASLKTFFETNDIPTGQNYSDLIDSQINIVETTAQSMAGALSTTELLTPRVSATNGNFIGDLAVSGNLSSTNGFFGGVGIVSAVGTTQGAAAALTNVINRGKGVTDGSATGFAIPANKTGLTQYIFNDALSANLYPPTGGTINGLSVNAAFAMAANTPYTILHITASAYAVK